MRAIVMLPAGRRVAGEGGMLPDGYFLLPIVKVFSYESIIEYEEEVVGIADWYFKVLVKLGEESEGGVLHSETVLFEFVSLEQVLSAIRVEYQKNVEIFERCFSKSEKAVKGDDVRRGILEYEMVAGSRRRVAKLERHLKRKGFLYHLAKRDGSWTICYLSENSSEIKELIKNLKIEKVAETESNETKRIMSGLGRAYREVRLVQAYLESLLRYGPPGSFKYTIYHYDASKKSKAIERIRESNSKVVDAPGSDDEDCGFTWVSL